MRTSKTTASKTTVRVIAALTATALFLGAAAAAGIDRGKDMRGNGAVVPAPIAEAAVDHPVTE